VRLFFRGAFFARRDGQKTGLYAPIPRPARWRPCGISAPIPGAAQGLLFAEFLPPEFHPEKIITPAYAKVYAFFEKGQQNAAPIRREYRLFFVKFYGEYVLYQVIKIL
jgi:hypothetical protein